MNQKFIIAFSEHRVLGPVLGHYFIREGENNDYYVLHEKVTLANLDFYRPVLSPDEVQLVKLTEQYNDQNLLQAFSKKKISTQVFLNSITEKQLTEQVRPYIERRIMKCIDILKYTDLPIYFKRHSNNIYESDRIYLHHEEVETIFNFHKDPDGLRYYLSILYNNIEITLTDKEGVILVNDPCYLILENQLFVFQDIDGKKLMPFFKKNFIDVPKKSEKEYLKTFVRKAIKKYKVKARGFEIIDQNVKPQPILSLENDLSGLPRLLLKFKYNEDTLYYANKKTELKVVLDEDGEKLVFYRLNRDYDFENSCITHLLGLGLVNLEFAYFSPIIKKHDTSNESLYGLVNWINFNVPELESSGYKIHQNYKNLNFYLQTLDLDVKVSAEEGDWFDIYAKVKIKDFEIPFIKFRNNIVNSIREYTLPDNEIVILPEEWFSRFKDLFSFGKEDGERLVLDKQHYTLISKNLDGISNSYKEKLKNWFSGSTNQEISIPQKITATLRNYQVEGFRWMYNLYSNGFGGCLADDMGLGKTLQTITIVQQVIDEMVNSSDKRETTGVVQQLSIFDLPGQSNQAPVLSSLVIVPTSLVFNWVNEINKFAPQIKVVPYVGSTRRELMEYTLEADIIITSYGIVRNDLAKFLQHKFLYLVLDESQMIKNPASKTYQAVTQLESEYKLVLTGTPIENSLIDLWAQLNFLNPGLLGNLNFFKKEFVTPIEKLSDEEKKEKLQTLIHPFVLRRTKEFVARDLPPVSQQVVLCEMDEYQEQYYVKEKSKARNAILENINRYGFDKSSIMILQTLTKLRQIASHPLMADEEYLGGSGKFEEVQRNLLNLIAEGHKAIIFSSFVKHLVLFQKYLDSEKINYALLTGKTKSREAEIAKFQENNNCPIFLISLKAGGVGLNLTAAEYVFLLDPWWNPASELQALSRAHRIGQDKQVFVYRFISKDTIEEKIIKLQDKKSKLADIFINEGSTLKSIPQEAILSLFD
ncbi:MAG: DEAD/DEAH box helicase [Bacteroidales bacterium]|nr:DEAD/DEAH box helicase [Bacteroidales bacterium]